MRLLHLSRLHTADTDTEPQAGAAPAPEAAAATPPAGTLTDAPPAGAERTYSPAEYREVQNEAKNLRRRLKELEDRQAAAEQAGMSEAERARAERDEARGQLEGASAELRAYRLRDAIEAAVQPPTLPVEGGGEQANPLHGISARLAVKLLDAGAVEADEAGQFKPAALRKALAALAAEFPEIRAQAESTARAPYPVQRATGGGPPPARPDVGSQYINQRYTTLPGNVTKR
jgi:hypothetical protein